MNGHDKEENLKNGILKQGNPGFRKHTFKSKSKEIVVRRISKLNNYN